jgi:hypothetical protein
MYKLIAEEEEEEEEEEEGGDVAGRGERVDGWDKTGVKILAHGTFCVAIVKVFIICYILVLVWY